MSPETIGELVERFARYDDKLVALHSDVSEIRSNQIEFGKQLGTLISIGKEREIREKERARILAEEDEKKEQALIEAAKLLEIRRIESEIRWTPVQRGIALVVVALGVASLSMEVWLNIFGGRP